jgi:hypothetical protein
MLVTINVIFRGAKIDKKNRKVNFGIFFWPKKTASPQKSFFSGGLPFS